MEGDISTKSKKGRKSGSKGRPNKAQGPKPRSQPAGPPPEIERIVKHVMNPDGKSAIWTVQMKGQPDNVTQDVDGPFFYETIARKRIWNEYLTELFSAGSRSLRSKDLMQDLQARFKPGRLLRKL